MSPWLIRLDARDRAWFARLALTSGTARSRRQFWTSLTHLGGARASIGLALTQSLLPDGSFALSWRTLCLLGLSHLVVQLIKRSVGRPRPSAGESSGALVLIPDRFSFPSGHACAAMALALGVASAVPALTVPLLIAALLVGFSRVMLGVHYPGDVLMGQAIALISAYPVLG
ncbi:phosphatase PAP2 family protein [Gemmatimonas sp.]|uniref:phosphatase PAP2 family protein n=1 Tax=Gemmatimonas sp. TaxID=1962908 RepID=UPI00286D8AF9|nr:phosphatase PAP2 family protein [Gemmatimonas sp.]